MADAPNFIPDSKFAPDAQIQPQSVTPDFIPENQFTSDKDYETPTEMAKTALEGAAAGPSFGLSRQLESHVLNNAAEQKARTQANPGLATISEFGGILAAPEAGAVGAVSKVGQAIEKVASPVIAKILGKTAGKIAGKGLGSAVEGAFYGAGNDINENALGDSDLNAETLVHNVGFGALFGGALGSALGLGEKVFTPEIEKAATKELHLENTAGEPNFPAYPTETPSNIEGIKELNKLAEEQDFHTSLPAKEALQQAKNDLIDEMVYLPNSAQLNSLDNPESRLRYQMNLKSELPGWEDLRQWEINQKHELSQKIIPKFIEDIAPESKLISNETEAGQKAIDDFIDQYKVNKAAEAPNFEKLDSVQTNSISDPGKILNSIYGELPELKKVVGVRGDGAYFTRPYDATTGLEKGTYNHFRDIVKALNKDELTVGDIRKLRESMFDSSRSWEKKGLSVQTSAIRKSLLDYMQEEVQKALPDAQVRDFMRRYAINEQNRGIMEKIVGGSISEHAPFGKGYQSEKVLDRIFSSQQNVAIAKDLLGSKWNETVANYLSHLHAKANDEVKGFSSAKFNRSINNVESGNRDILNLALEDNPEKLQKIRSATTAMRAGADLPPGNPSDTASATRLIKESRKWIDAFHNPSSILGHVITAVADKLSEAGALNAANKMLEKRAEESFAQKAQKYNAYGKIERMQQQVINKISKDVARVVSPEKISGAKGLVAQKLTPEDQQKKFDKISTQIKELAGNPEKLMDQLQTSTKSLYDIAPTIATSLTTTMARANSFLATKLPAQDPPSPGMPAYKPSQGELAKFNRYYQAVEKPLSVLDQVKTGTLTTESLEALQTVHPKLYNAMKSEMLDQFFGSKKAAEIPYSNRLMMSMFLGQDLTNSLKPANIASAQVTGAPQQQQPPSDTTTKPKNNQKGMEKLKSSQHLMTDFQKSSQRVE